MFDIGFPELLLIAIVGLLVIGPERLPEALRTLGLWIGRMRRSFTNVKTEIEKEIGMDEIRRQLHNEAVMEEMKRIERDVRDSVHAAEGAPSSRTQGSAAVTADSAADAAAQAPAVPAPEREAGQEPAQEPSQEKSEEPPPERTQADDARHG
ncbi:MAG: Sec-independent protein translocase protein TatB [Gammaproteobacteria bacterium]|nr:Sec-independent protein translocase protein TatB [Gammaproteobacteria bacterium]